MWIAFAVGSAFFSGLTSILAKCGIRTMDSTVATAMRTLIVLAFSWLMVFIVGSAESISTLSPKTWLFLVLSGMATGASWLCYFRALQLGNVNKVVPIDKSSTILTMILAFIVFREPFTWVSLTSICLIGAGTLMMIQKKADDSNAVKGHHSWLFFAVLSAVFASLTAILGKIGIEDVESNLGTAIRTLVVLVMAWLMVFVKGKKIHFHELPKREIVFLCLSGVATGASWLCYYRALQTGPASIVVPIDKLGILVTIAFSYVVLGEKLSRKAALGLLFIVVGTLVLLLPTV